MKSWAVLLLVTVAARAADFATGQAARLVIGQPTFTKQDPNSSDEILGAVSGLAYANDTLFVCDSNRVGASPINNRVLIYKNLSRMLPAPTAELLYDRRCPVCGGRATLVLGQPDFKSTEWRTGPDGLRSPNAVATDGTILAVADTDNNRVLIWFSIPAYNRQPADVVVGQPDFKTVTPNTGTGDPRVPGPKTLRGPEGVWIQGGRLFVADTGNDRVLIWNRIPRENFAAADIVLGQKDFGTGAQVDPFKAPFNPQADTMLSPVAVSSDGQRLFVTDLGYNRVLIWNSIPTRNAQPADVVIGQPDMTSGKANNVEKLCEPTGKDEEGKDVFPKMCLATLDFPRFALSDGRRLFIADGGNDRVLVFNRIPTENGASADVVLGQIAGTINQASDSAYPLRRASADSLRTPLSLAWDGENLYVSDPFNRRIMVFTVAERHLPVTGVRNAASREVYAVGYLSFSGSIKEDDEITITIEQKEYKYKIVKDDTFQSVIRKIIETINAGDGDPNVLATPNYDLNAIILTARMAGEAGNEIEISAKTSDNAQISVSTSGAKLSGGMDAAKIAPGTLVSIVGDDLADFTESAPPDADPLPTELGGVQVYFDGIRAPLLYVSPTQINAQVPYEVLDTTSINAYVRTRHRDGRVTITTPIAVPIIKSNPGIFAFDGPDPRPAVAFHASSHASGTVSVDGTAKAGDVATVIIEDREYSYTVQEGDTLATIRDALIELINQDPKVFAFPAGQWTRIRLRARIPGPEGNGIVYSAKASEGAQVIMTPTTPALCCANVEGALVTPDNPALPGETIYVYATGLGIIKPEQARLTLETGARYKGPELNEPLEFVSSLAGGKTANVLLAAMVRGQVGVYRVDLELNSDLPTNPFTQVTIAQDVYVSNIVTIPVVNPNPSQ
ncbi:MAG: hypothetical protein RMI94_10375 [Bryobacterales bacterium]|nr:hypothetical protein [Bryobacteraceae bacterium]MDW8130944.1 hypothetical protein [Bryobacterales bacterium]